MGLSIIFLEDKHNILLHVSIFYEYQQFFQHRICFPITNETSHVTTHATHSDPWPTLARSTSLFLICCYNNYNVFDVLWVGCFHVIMRKRPCCQHRGIMWPSLVKIQYTEVKLSCGNDPVAKIIFIVTVTLTFDLMTPNYLGFFPFHRGIMWPSLVKIRFTELKLSCGNLCGRPSPAARHTQSHNTTPSQDGRIKT
jgi:hypothetical protein